MDYTNALNHLFETGEAFRRAAFQWNQLDEESKKNDLIKVFGYPADIRFDRASNFDDMLVLSRLLSGGDISPQSLLLIPDLAIKVALSYQEEVASWMRSAFCRNSVYKKLERSYIVEQIFSVVANAGDDGFVYRSGWDMLYDMGFKKELLEFMERFKKELEGEIDENDRQDVMDMPDEEDLV